MELMPVYEEEKTAQGATIEAESPFPEPSFIEANTLCSSLEELSTKHIIPVFVKENIPTISQADFITHTLGLVEEVSGKKATNLQVRVSHPIKGRIFEARHKKAEHLEEWEKTLYYERMAFTAQIPEYREVVDGKELLLTFGGIKAYNLDNLYSNSHSVQRFKFFMGYTVKACTNLCVWTDGFAGDIKVRTIQELQKSILDVLNAYDMVRHPQNLQRWCNFELSEHEVAQILGRARIYQHLPYENRKNLPELMLSDSQVNAIARGYLGDEHFKRNDDGSISLWNFYNLMTESVKSSYIDTFLDRNVNCSTFMNGISQSLDKGIPHWFLN